MFQKKFFISFKVKYSSCIYSLQRSYRKTSGRSRVPHIRWVPDTGRGSRQLVLIKAGRLQAGSLLEAGGKTFLSYYRYMETHQTITSFIRKKCLKLLLKKREKML